MSNFARKPQENEGSYFFSGRLFITQGVQNALAIEEVHAIHRDVKAFVVQENGIDYLQVYEFEDGRVVWLIDQLNKEMIESGDYEAEDNHCTMLLPEEYWKVAASWVRSSIFVKYDTQKRIVSAPNQLLFSQFCFCSTNQTTFA